MNRRTILVTGSEGLIGTALTRRLRAAGFAVLGLDIRARDKERRIDIVDAARLAPLLDGVDGIVHLAAVSRVVEGELDPERCRAVNVDATRALLDAALAARRRPWFIHASSREVYGQQDDLPVHEGAPFRPMNTYARSKVEAERLCREAGGAGLKTAVVRFSSVYGSAADHATRVVPAFLRAAVTGGTLRVDGNHCTFDLTHVEDAADGVARLVDLLEAGDPAPPPIHFVSGVGITLADLAEQAIALGGHRARMVTAPPRAFDISRFVGDPARARSVLGWTVTTDLGTGLARLAADFAAEVA